MHRYVVLRIDQLHRSSDNPCVRFAVQVAIGIGDLSWAQQCFRLAAALDPGHAEALNNLGVLQLKRRQAQQVG
jgi:Tfp pilus assembly protein PilF